MGVTDVRSTVPSPTPSGTAEAVLQAWTIPRTAPYLTSRQHQMAGPVLPTSPEQQLNNCTQTSQPRNCQGRDKHKLREEISFLRRSKVGVNPPY